MTEGNKRVLSECFSLLEHPFEPQGDPRRNLDFQALGVSLAKTLDVFKVKELGAFLLRTGPFETGINTIDGFLDGLPAGGDAPAFLIEGSKGVGRSTMANYIASRIKERNQDKASLYEITVGSEHFGKLLFTIKAKIAAHIRKFQVSDCDDALNSYSEIAINPQDPSQEFLLQIFTDLRACLAGAPPLVLVIESINFMRQDWIEKLSDALGQLNVVLIFLTEDPRVRNHFVALRNGALLKGIEVRLTPLDRQMAEDFLKARLEAFRADQTPLDRAGLFPFVSQVLMEAIPPGKTIGIKLLEYIVHGAFNMKVEELAPKFPAPNQEPNPPIMLEQMVIPFEYLKRYYASSLRSGN